MRLLVLQLSDIHFQSHANPIEERRDSLVQAVLSIHPYPDACLILITGDIANSGESAQYDRASAFFKSLKHLIGCAIGHDNVVLDYIPGNHDCNLPKAEVSVREAIVSKAQQHIAQKPIDSGYLSALLAPQKAFNEFYERMTGQQITEENAISRCVDLRFGDTYVRLLSINSALL